MKILFPYLARWKAVNWTRYHSILTQLAYAGHEIHIIQAPKMSSEEANFQDIDIDIPENIFLYEADINSKFWKRKWPLDKLAKKGYYALSTYGLVKKIIEEKNIDILLLYNLPHYPLLSIKGCIKIFDYADDYMDMLKYEMGKLDFALLLNLGKRLLEKMMREANITFCISNVLAKSAKGNVYTLPNGVDADLAVIGSGKSIKQQYKKPIIGFIGSFEYFIDFTLILNAARLLPEATFLLVGSGRKWNHVANKIKELSLTNIFLIGGVPHAEIFKYIDAMDICLNIFKKLPISHAACPIKLFEYLVMKKPVISTRLKEVEIINNDFLFFADTAEEFVDCIKKIIKHGSLAQSYAMRGYKVVIEKYTWPKIAEEFITIAGKHAGKK